MGLTFDKRNTKMTNVDPPRNVNYCNHKAARPVRSSSVDSFGFFLVKSLGEIGENLCLTAYIRMPTPYRICRHPLMPTLPVYLNPNSRLVYNNV